MKTLPKPRRSWFNPHEFILKSTIINLSWKLSFYASIYGTFVSAYSVRKAGFIGREPYREKKKPKANCGSNLQATM